jgi:amidase
MTITEYDDYDAVGLAELVARKDVTPLELLDEAIARAEALNPKINAIIHKDYDRARELALALPEPGPDKPLHGVPFLLKDVLGFCQGLPNTSGSGAPCGGAPRGPAAAQLRPAARRLRGHLVRGPRFRGGCHR